MHCHKSSSLHEVDSHHSTLLCAYLLRTSTGLGGNPAPKRDLRRFVKWPKYVRLQRQRRVLSMRLKVPPVLNQFVTRALVSGGVLKMTLAL
jgi:hypothetical protein